MAETLKENERLVRIGVTAMRKPDGTIASGVPVYEKVPMNQAQEDSARNFESLKEDERLVQVGATAKRRPDRSFLPSKPIYIKVPADEVNEDGFSEGEEELMQDVSAFLAGIMRQYIKESRKIIA